MTMRDVTHLVEDALLQCHSEEAMREILRKPPELAKELCHEDRRDLDDCVFELFGVTDKKKRQILLEELYPKRPNTTATNALRTFRRWKIVLGKRAVVWARRT